LKLNLRRRVHADWLAAGGAQQAVEQRNDGTAGFIKTADGGYHTLAGFALLVAEGLHELRVAVAACTGELDGHDASAPNWKNIADTLSQQYCLYRYFNRQSLSY